MVKAFLKLSCFRTEKDTRDTRAPAWGDITGQGIPDYARLNEKRLPATHQLDLRVDKKYYFKKWSLNLYFDVQNAYGYQTRLPAYLNVRTNEAGEPIADPDDPARYETYLLENATGTVLPTLGVIVEI